MSLNPYVVGQWVRGQKFYGRAALIDAILHGNRNCLWVLGTRRIGKTSLLKQVELTASSSPDAGFFPVFWDFQGAEDPQDLHEGFADSLLDTEDRLEDCGISPQDVEAADLFTSLRKLRRALRGKDLKLLLLCDEVEELIGINERDPALLKKLRRSMQSHDDVRSVLASKIKLWELSQEQADTSPFLEAFTPPLYIRPLEDEEARALIRQANLPSESRPRLDEQAVERVREQCNNHPYLIQVLCERYMELEDLEASIEHLASDPMVSYFFSVDFEMLTDTERRILHTVSSDDSYTSVELHQQLSATSATVDGCLHRLEHLGYVRRGETRQFELANYFFRRWFSEHSPALPATGKTAPFEAGRAPSMLDDDPTPEIFDDRYELLEKLGAGSMGVVYKVQDRMLQDTVALKVLKAEYSSDKQWLERFRREILLGRDLEHPNILTVYHLGEFDGRKYLTMKLVEGSTLTQTIRDNAPLPVHRTLEIALQMAAALEAAHDKGVVHRDVKPDNIMMDGAGKAMLTDFGVARLQDQARMTMTGTFLGTPDYASPEQARFETATARSDLYSLGVVIFEMAAGRKPFVGESISEVLKMHLSAAPPRLEELRPDTPPALCAIVLRCLQKDPAARFETASELHAALAEVEI